MKRRTVIEVGSIVLVTAGVLAAGIAYASIPDSSGVIHGCYKTKGGSVRVIDPGSGGVCKSKESAIEWSGPTFLATGLVFPDGSVGYTTGLVPTVTHPATGQYTLALSGLGSGCPVPQLGVYGPSGRPTISFNGGTCGGGAFSSNVLTGDGTDQYWTYMFVGSAPAAASISPTRALPSP